MLISKIIAPILLFVFLVYSQGPIVYSKGNSMPFAFTEQTLDKAISYSQNKEDTHLLQALIDNKEIIFLKKGVKLTIVKGSSKIKVRVVGQDIHLWTLRSAVTTVE